MINTSTTPPVPLFKVRSRQLRGHYGRIIRTRPDRPLALAEDDQRRAVMVMGPSGLHHILDKPGYEMLHSIGHSHAYIERKLREGFAFELLIFPFDRGDLKIATWKNSLALLKRLYPEISHLIDRHGKRLRSEQLKSFEAEAGFSFAEVDNGGSADPRYMTLDKLLASPGSAADLRRFLFHTVRLSELFTGDGFTKKPDGTRGVREYIVANRPVASLKSYQLIPLNVTLPDAPASTGA
jgi:hypothetical protein